MSKKRNRYNSEFKFRVALEAAKGLKTINDLASEAGIHPTMGKLLETAASGGWKRDLWPQWGPKAKREPRTGNRTL